jgi:hypothetical protein
MTHRTDECPAVVETRVVHDTHRRATSLLADAIVGDRAPGGAVAALRELVVAMLRHHHESEDRELWPILTAAAPSLADPLGDLSREHDRLDDALDRVAASTDEASAIEVRDLVHDHLAHEEPILFPALRAHVTDDQWTAFFQRAVARAPRVGTDLLVALLHQVASEDDVEVILQHLPPDARAAVPAMRAGGEQTLYLLAGPAR